MQVAPSRLKQTIREVKAGMNVATVVIAESTDRQQVFEKRARLRSNQGTGTRGVEQTKCR
jgi:hypothetical protein